MSSTVCINLFLHVHHDIMLMYTSFTIFGFLFPPHTHTHTHTPTCSEWGERTIKNVYKYKKTN